MDHFLNLHFSQEYKRFPSVVGLGGCGFGATPKIAAIPFAYA